MLLITLLPKHITLSMKHEKQLRAHVREAILAIIATIDNNPFEKRSLYDLTIETGLNRNVLQLGFKQLLGTTFKQYVIQKRLERARALLEEGRLTRKQIAYKCGYKSLSAFSTAFKKVHGLAPKEIGEYA